MKSQPQTAALPAARGRRSASGGADLLVLAGVIVLANLPLLRGHPVEALGFRSTAVAAGEWWRLFTHPFVHVSRYHLLLDAGAFLMLYHGMQEAGRARRLTVAVLAAAGSLAAACLTAASRARGLCGLSGAAHGLMAATALEMLLQGRERSTRYAGGLGLALVTGKSLLEAVTGSVFLVDLHFGYVGTPVAACHLGGVLGGLAAWLAAKRSSRPVQ